EKADASKRVMGPTPLTPPTRAAQLSRDPRPSGDTMPIPVITTLLAIVLFRAPPPAAPCLRVALDVLHRIADAVDLLGVLVADLDLERLLERHAQLDGVERGGAEIVHERRLHRHLLGVDSELLDDDRLDLVFDALSHH